MGVLGVLFFHDLEEAIVAQLAERRLPKPQVAGSNPVYRSHRPAVHGGADIFISAG